MKQKAREVSKNKKREEEGEEEENEVDLEQANFIEI